MTPRTTGNLPRPRARLALLLAAASQFALAQPADPTEPSPGPPSDPSRMLLDMFEQQTAPEPQAPKIHPAVQALILADYLTDDERKAIRLRHGLWELADLESPSDRARAALTLNALSDHSLTDPATDPILRAEASLRRGECAQALAILDNATPDLIEADSLAAHRVRAQALFDLARFDDADAAVQPVVDRMLAEPITDADELAEGVRALMLRARIRGSQRQNGGDFQTLKSIIEQGRDELDRLSWQIRLAEAELLIDKHNLEDAAAALKEALALNPRSAAARTMLAHLFINSFAFDQAEAIIQSLRDDADTLAIPNADPDAFANPDTALLEARMRLRQRDPDAALAILRPAREAHPASLDLLAWHAAAEAAAFDETRSDTLLADLDARAPGTPLGHYTVGRVLSEARQYDESIAALEAARDRLPNWSQPHIDLGLVLIQAGRDAQAQRVLSKAVDLDPFNARARNSLELVRGLAEFATTESDHFIIRHAPATDGSPALDALLAREMLPVLERIHDRVTADPNEIPGGVGHEPAQKTLIEIMPSHAWFSVRITGMTRIHTMAAATGPVIAMESPREGPGFTVGPFDWPRVLQHEYTHTVTLSKTRNRIPHWFTEATAVFCEDAPRDESTWRLLARAHETGTLFDLTDINTAFVRPKKPTDRGQAYAQGHWMVQFLVDRWGPETPARLMDRYAAGEREQSAFEAELGISTDAFMSAFTEWAAADLRRVGLLPPLDTPTIPEMLEADRREADEPGTVTPDSAFVARWQTQYPDHPGLAELAVNHALAQTRPNEPRLAPTAVEALDRLTRVVPVTESPHRLLARHYLAGDADDRARAIDHLVFLDAREQNSATYAIELATRCAEVGQLERAIAYADRAARIDPFDADIREFAARVALQHAVSDADKAPGRFTPAAHHIEALTIIEPTVEKHRQRLDRVKQLSEQ